VLVRDNKFITGGGTLSFSPLSWREFIEAVKKI
jgi:hypothetical protein